MKLVLHVGIHKTGTSAIQAFCKENRAALAELGLLYPTAGLIDLDLTSTPSSEAGHRGFQDVLITPVNQNSEALLRDISEEAKSFDNVHTVLISCETFSAPRVKISTSVPESLQRYFSETSILMYLRRQDVWAESFYKEVLCWPRKRVAKSFKRFASDFLPEWLDYIARVNKWSEIFGDENLIVRSYDDRSNKNIIIDFFDQLGFDVSDQQRFKFPGYNNPSLPNDLIPLMLKINRYKLNRQQRSRITNRIFKELSESTYSVTRIPVLTPSIIGSMAASFAAMNRTLADRFQIGSNDKLCGFGDYEEADSEISLTGDQVSEIERMVVDINQQNRDKNQLAKGRKDEGRVGVSCLLNEAPRQVKLFVAYHLALGVSRIRLYFDNPDDPMASYDYGSDKVEVVLCSDEFWHERLGRRPENNAEKLSTCHKHGLNDLNKREDIDWVINLDADELLYVKPGDTLSSYLSSVRSFHLQIRVRPLEAIFVTEEDTELFGARYFKIPRLNIGEKRFPAGRKLLGRLYVYAQALIEKVSNLEFIRRIMLKWSQTACIFLAWSEADERVYNRHMPQLSRIMRDGFLAHRLGRIFSRHGLEFDYVASHKPEFSGRKPMMLHTNNTIFVLHYDAADYAAWHLKWHRRIYGETTVSAIHDKRRMQQDLFKQANEEGEQATRELFRSFFVFPESSLSDFERAGLLIKLDLPLLKKVNQEIGA